KLYLEDWNRFFDHLKITQFERRCIRIAAGTHWYFGHYLKDVGKNMKALEYLKKLETFINDEFDNPTIQIFKEVLAFVIIISISDNLGSTYNTNIESHKELTNYLPNISLNSLNNSNDLGNVNNQIISKSFQLNSKDMRKRLIFTNL